MYEFLLIYYQFSDCDDSIQSQGPNGEVCLGLVPAFTWSSLRNKCILSRFGGCFPSINNFRTLEECEQIAKPVCEKN